MPANRVSRFIQCHFEPPINRTINFPTEGLEVYYGITKDINLKFLELTRCISEDERLRADKFLCPEDKSTYISCHGLFRSIISKKLHQEPINVVIKYDIRRKPQLLGNPYYFNISHTKDAFAFVVSKSFYVGIDIEKADRGMDILPIIKSYFSIKEQRFILSSTKLMHDNFTLLWTRKEALLKAVGIGIVDNLAQIEVSEKNNIISRGILGSSMQNMIFNDHFIFSEKIKDFFISIAMPQKSKAIMHRINAENITSYIE